jgi:hypothetical protein
MNQLSERCLDNLVVLRRKDIRMKPEVGGHMSAD